VGYNFYVPQLHRFISHVEAFKASDRAEVLILDDSIHLSIKPKPRLELQIDGRALDRQLFSLAQVCSPSFPLISALEELKITKLSSPYGEDDMKDAEWLEFLDLFTALKNLYLTEAIARRVCGALQELSGESVAEVLPALRNIFID